MEITRLESRTYRATTNAPLFIRPVRFAAPHNDDSPNWAWGRLGHRVISRLAEKQMTPKAKAAIADLLEPGESLADASTWADENRGELPKTAPWHYVDVPLDEPKYDAKFRRVPTIGCVVDKINEFRLVIKDKTKTVEERRFALRFLIHCVEDMHMPCTSATTRTRAATRRRCGSSTEGTNMHRLWDSRHDRADRRHGGVLAGRSWPSWTRQRPAQRR